MENINVVSDVGRSLTRVDTVGVNKENHSSVVGEQVAVKNQQVQKVAEEQAIEKGIAPAELEEVVSEINHMMETVQRDLNFSVDENSGREVISVYEKGTDKLIRQLPSEEALKILDNLEQLKGLLFKTDV